MNIKEILQREEYNFLRTDEHCRDNIMLLALGGSYAYGTNNKNSDLDIRGICFNKREQLLGFDRFEQYVETVTDTVIYSFSKMIPLLLSCNPNTIEILGCKAEHYIEIRDEGKLLKDNAGLFLSKIAAHSFLGYATQQMRRLQNAIARDALSKKDKEKHIMNSLQNQIIHFKHTYEDFEYGSIKLNLNEEGEVTFDINLKNYPIRDFLGIYSEMSNCVRDYDKIRHRNNKKDEIHLNKHAMHLVRLYFMGLDILTGKGINTFREKEHDLLIEIRNGKYMNSDGTYNSEFFEFVEELEKDFEYARENTDLPDKPDLKKVEELVIEINERGLKRDYEIRGIKI